MFLDCHLDQCEQFMLMNHSSTIAHILCESWSNNEGRSDFFYLKGVTEAVLSRLGLQNYSERPIDQKMFSEGLTLMINKKNVVNLGVVQSAILKPFGIDQNVLFADFNWNEILNIIRKNKITFRAIPKYPEVRRDFALLIDEAVNFDAIYSIARKTEKQLLKSVNLFDVYQGKNLPKGKKSYAVSFTFQDDKKTLTDKQVDKVMNKLQMNFEKQLGAELR